MARTFNRRPVTIDGPDNSDIKNYTFNYEQWKGIDDGKNFLSVDQSTFSDAQNMYIDSEGLLSSRPAVEPVPDFITIPQKYSIEKVYPVNDDITVYVCIEADTYKYVIIRDANISGLVKYLTVVETTEGEYSVKTINSNEKLYLFVTNTNINNSTSFTKLYIYDKTKCAMLTEADALKSIYIPTTKIFTGNNEEEGEAANLWSTSEKYLYYYNDVTGISGDAIGKTLTWEGKRLKWNNNFKKYLTKDYYNIGDSNIASVAATGAVAWVQSNILYYAVNGAIIYSWDCSSLIDASHAITKIYFSDASDIILIHVSDSDNIYHATYIVSCVSTNEDNTLKYPKPTELLSLVGLTPQPDIYSISCEKFIDESAWMIALLSGAAGSDGAVVYSITIVYKYNDLQKEVTTRGDAIGVDFTANLLAVISAYENASDQKKYYRIKLLKRSEDGKSLVEVGYKDYLISTLPQTTNRSYLVVFKLTAANIIAYIPDLFGGSSVDSQYYVICVPTNDLLSKNVAVMVNHLDLYSYPPVVLRDSPLIALFKNKSYDCSKCDFVNDTIRPTESTYSVDITTPLESTTSLYNHITQVGNENHIFTRLSTDTFELYYDKLGEVTYPESITDILYLNNYFFAVDNVSYYTENKYNDDGEFLFYLPDKNRNEFDSPIVKFHQIGDDIIGIFFENEIHYAKYDSNISTYRYYRTKLQFGIPKGSEVITSDDSITTYIPTRTGIVALSYQNFISATEQGTVRISDKIFDTAVPFFTNGYIRITKYRYWVIFYNPFYPGNVAWVYDTRNQSWWKQVLPYKIVQIYLSGTILFGVLLTGNNIEYRFTVEAFGIKRKYMDNIPSYPETKYIPINWYFKSQKLHLGAPNYFKSIQGMTFFDSAEDNYENIFDLETYAYRDKPYVNGEQNIHYNVRMIRTYLLRLHTMKTNEFQFKISSDNTIAQDDSIRPIKLSSISIRYRITGEVR